MSDFKGIKAIAVPNYRVYLLNPAGKIVRGEWIEATNDGDARAAAHAMCGPGTPKIEVWQGARRIAVLPCDDGDEPAAPTNVASRS